MWFRRKAKANPITRIRGLRQRALHISAAELGIDAQPTGRHVWCVLMEIGYPDAIATLVAFLDGATSLHFSNGGGVIVAGEHTAVRAASVELLAAVDAHVAEFVPARETPLPPVGRVRFYARVGENMLTAEGDEQALGLGQHALSPVFHAGHAVIAAVREATTGDAP